MQEFDITSKEFLDKAIENAKIWCENNLPKYLRGFKGEFNYDIFHYVIDNDMIADMKLDEEKEGLIYVSTKKLKWYLEREKLYEKDELYSKIRDSVEVDPESMFVHEIVEFILHIPELFDRKIYFSKYFFRAHEIAREIENINRRERGLKDWPEY